MWVDVRNEFCNATPISTTPTANAVLGNVIDRKSTGSTLIDLGAGEQLYLVVAVTTAVAGLTSLRLRLYSDSTENLATSPTTHWDTGVVALASGWNSTGIKYRIPLPISATYERYIGIWQNVVGTATNGVVDIYLTREPVAWTPAVDVAD